MKKPLNQYKIKVALKTMGQKEFHIAARNFQEAEEKALELAYKFDKDCKVIWSTNE